MKNKTYYKVISVGRKSFMWDYLDVRCTVTYPIRKWAKPRIKNSSLMVFASKKHATEFWGGNELYDIVPCYIKKSKTRRSFILPVAYSLRSFRRFWKGENTPNCFDKKEIPEGTVFADAVYCLK